VSEPEATVGFRLPRRIVDTAVGDCYIQLDFNERKFSARSFVMPFGLGPTELIIILVIALIIFGPSRLPKIGQSIGQALRAFRESTDKVQDEVKKSLEETVTGEEEKK
jgi:sec-independent protein translocase protein TatA